MGAENLDTQEKEISRQIVEAGRKLKVWLGLLKSIISSCIAQGELSQINCGPDTDANWSNFSEPRIFIFKMNAMQQIH